MLKIFFALCLTLSGCSRPTPVNINEGEDPVIGAEGDSRGFTPVECGYSVGDIACDFELPDATGGVTHLYDFKGDVIVLDFSTAWCYYCQIAALDVQTIQDAHIAEGFTYITVLVEGFDRNPPTEDFLKEWADHFGMTSAPVLGGDHALLDPTSEEGWLVEAWPTFYYLDREMRIVEYQRGFSAEYLTAMIESLLSN